MREAMTGILCVDKPQNMTSFLCCAIARRCLGGAKVGHAGTLDPNATGVLPLLIGKATKALDFLPRQDKRYVATMRFGAVSDTLDIWGAVSPTGKPLPTREMIENTRADFTGDILQIPPMTSALKRDGVRLYDLARQGIEVDREPRPVTVHALTVLGYDPETGELTVDCHCSKGTYIRTLCDDWGQKLGCGAVMTALRRVEAAGFSESDCLTVDDLRARAENGTLADAVRPLDAVFSPYPAVTVTAAQAVRFRNGGSLARERLRTTVTGLVRVLDPDGNLLGLGSPQGDQLAIALLL